MVHKRTEEKPKGAAALHQQASPKNAPTPLVPASTPEPKQQATLDPQQNALLQQGRLPQPSYVEGDAVLPERKSETWEWVKRRWAAYYPSHKHQVWYMATGFLIALGFIYLGFLKTLLICVLTGIGMICGRFYDGDVNLRERIYRLVKRF